MQDEMVGTEVTATASVAPTTAQLKKDCCSTGDCGTCLKGGMPLKKEKLSFLVLLSIGLTTVFFALWVNQLRKNDQLTSQTGETVAQGSQSGEAQKQYKAPVALPALSTIELPAAATDGKMSVETALAERRSRRVFSEETVTLKQLGQVLWAGQGITDESGHRAAPSARSLYPFTMYVVVRAAEGLEPGLYRYEPVGHKLAYLGSSDAGEKLAASGVQDNSQKAPVVIVLSADVSKMVEKFPDDPRSVVMLEGGHIGQNIYLQVESLQMSTVVTAGFDTVAVGAAIGLDPNEEVVYLVPFGHTGAEAVAE